MRYKYLAIVVALLLMGLSLGACRSGEIQWQKSYGGADDDEAYSIQETADGGYIVAGLTESFGARWDDLWVSKLDPNGNITGCLTMAGSNAVIGDTNIAGAITKASVVDTSIEPTNTNIAPLDTDCSVDTQCCYP
jgi:hypothetical protein